MRGKKRKGFVLLGLILVLCLSGCGKKQVEDTVNIRVGSLKGPTSLGLLGLIEQEKEEAQSRYTFQMATTGDELSLLLVKGELDIALLPANMAAILYQKTEGQITVLNLNTLGVLYGVSGDAEITSLEDLKGRTVYLTGKGVTPEASLRYLLSEAGLTEQECTLEFLSEASEAAAVLAEHPEAVGVLPQPFVTAALMQNEKLQVVLDLNEIWKEGGNGDYGMVTGVTVVRSAFLEEHPEAVRSFLEEQKKSVETVLADPQAAAVWAVEEGIVAKEPIAAKAIPECNLVCVTGQEMKTALSGYLEVLENFKPELIGGKLPDEDFYYEAEK